MPPAANVLATKTVAPIAPDTTTKIVAMANAPLKPIPTTTIPITTTNVTTKGTPVRPTTPKKKLPTLTKAQE